MSTNDWFVLAGFFVAAWILVKLGAAVLPLLEQAAQTKEPPAPTPEPDNDHVGWQRPAVRHVPPNVDERVMRLIRFLENTEGRTPAERATFLAKAQELRRRHGL